MALGMANDTLTNCMYRNFLIDFETVSALGLCYEVRALYIRHEFLRFSPRSQTQGFVRKADTLPLSPLG